MTEFYIAYQHDRRTIDELVNVALTECDEEAAWDAVCAMHYRGTREVLDRAKLLCRSACSQERSLGADILGQLLVSDVALIDVRRQTLVDMLSTEVDADVLESVLIAISHLYDPTTTASVLTFLNHPEPGVRYGVALAINCSDDQAAMEGLIKLSNDVDDRVRDWATFGIGVKINMDTPEIRAALAARLDDPHVDTRGEAIRGLAFRKDPRAVAAVVRELQAGWSGSMDLIYEVTDAAPELFPQYIT